MAVQIVKSGMNRPFTASGDIVVGQVVKLSSTADYAQVAEDGYTGLKGVCVGGYQYKTSTGDNGTANTIAEGFICDIALPKSHIVKLTAVAAIAKGAPIEAAGNAGGSIKENVEGAGGYSNFMGYAMEAATASGDIIECLI